MDGMLYPCALAFCISGSLVGVLEQQVFLPQSSAGEGFGVSVCISGDTLVVGAENAFSGGVPYSGSAHVYVRSGRWTHSQELVPSAPQVTGYFGRSVALSDEFLAVGASGADQVYVFRNVEGFWKPHAVVSPDDGSYKQSFGYSVSLDGDELAVGAFGNNTLASNAGAVFLYKCDQAGATLIDTAYALDGTASQWFGRSVSISNGRLLAGAPTQTGKGSAYVFVQGTNGWSQEQKLKPTGITSFDYFGDAVSLSGDMALIGAKDTYWGNGRAGAAYVFERKTTWTQQIQLRPPTSTDFQFFGAAVSIDGDFAVVGARGDQTAGLYAGTAYLYSRVAGQWTGQGQLLPPGTTAGDTVGKAVGLSGVTPVVAAPSDKAFIPEYTFGSVSIFSLDTSPASTYCTAGTSGSGCTATLSAAGSASASATSGFLLSATTVEGAKDGLFFFGTSGPTALPWGTGTSLQCVWPPTIRLGLLLGSGTPGQCDGAFAQDINATWCASCPQPTKNPGPGAVVQAQLWYRDPMSTSNQKTSLSDAVEFTLAP